MHTTNCLNCDNSLAAGAAYCSSCGQKAAVHRISFHELWHDVIHYFTHADKGIFHLFGQLAVRPGVVAREYIEGKRNKYFKPLNFWLIVAGMLVFVTSFFYKPKDDRSQRIESYAQTIKDPVRQQKMLGMAERTRNVAKITGKYSNVINMVATPLLSIFFWLVYKKRGYNYTEHLVANMYFVGFVMIFYAFVFFPLQAIVPDKISIVVLGSFFLFEILYRGRAYFQLIGDRSKKAVFKAYGISLLLSVLWFALTFSLIMLYIRYGF